MRHRSRLDATLPPLCLLFAFLLAASAALGASAPASPDEPVRESHRVSVVLGKSILLSSQADVTRVSVAKPEVADFLLLSPRQIYVTGKSPGVTNLTLWGQDNQPRRIYDVEVAPDVSLLKKMLHDVLPDEPGLEVRSANNTATLSGSARSADSLSKAVALAEAYYPGKVVNLVQVGGSHQVMLEVRVAEMSKTLLNRLGFNLQYAFNQDFFYTFLGNLTQLQNIQQLIGDDGRLVAQRQDFNISQKVTAAFRATDGRTSWSGFIDALKENGLIKVLAEPTLVCLSGQTASFLAGGEIPIPVPQGLGTVAIEYKEFGVGLKFTPTVLSGDRISLQVAPEVSELDYANGIVINSFRIPALTTRKAATMVELGDGQSFAIAGLLSNTAREVRSRLPLVGDVPILGNLFRSDSFQNNETELVIIATPRLAKTLDKSAQRLPTDKYRAPDDWEFFLNLPSKGAEGGDELGGVSGLDGRFGVMMPEIAAMNGRAGQTAGEGEAR